MNGKLSNWCREAKIAEVAGARLEVAVARVAIHPCDYSKSGTDTSAIAVALARVVIGMVFAESVKPSMSSLLL